MFSVVEILSIFTLETVGSMLHTRSYQSITSAWKTKWNYSSVTLNILKTTKFFILISVFPTKFIAINVVKKDCIFSVIAKVFLPVK